MAVPGETTRAAYEAVEAAIREAHSYEEPEIVATPIVARSTDYLAWIAGTWMTIGELTCL